MSARSAYAIYGKSTVLANGSSRASGDRESASAYRGTPAQHSLESILGSAVQRLASERSHDAPAPPAYSASRSASGAANPRLKRFSAASDPTAAQLEPHGVGNGVLTRMPSAGSNSGSLFGGSPVVTGRRAFSGRPATGGNSAGATTSPVSIQNLQLGVYASSKPVRPRSSSAAPFSEPRSPPPSVSRTGERR